MIITIPAKQGRQKELGWSLPTIPCQENIVSAAPLGTGTARGQSTSETANDDTPAQGTVPRACPDGNPPNHAALGP